jgi:hypothetical protein
MVWTLEGGVTTSIYTEENVIAVRGWTEELLSVRNMI